MTQELREVVRAMFWQARNSSADIEDLTDAAIALVLEGAARVAMASPADYGSPRSYCEGRSAATAAIRNLRSQHDPR